MAPALRCSSVGTMTEATPISDLSRLFSRDPVSGPRRLRPSIPRGRSHRRHRLQFGAPRRLSGAFAGADADLHEKAMCALGKGVITSGRLAEEGVRKGAEGATPLSRAVRNDGDRRHRRDRHGGGARTQPTARRFSTRRARRSAATSHCFPAVAEAETVGARGRLGHSRARRRGRRSWRRLARNSSMSPAGFVAMA